MSLDADGEIAPFSLPPSGAQPKLIEWAHPFASTRIAMEPHVVKTLSTESLRWVLNKPAAEIGGILWGRFEEVAQRRQRSSPMRNLSFPKARSSMRQRPTRAGWRRQLNARAIQH